MARIYRIDDELAELCQGLSHPDYPCLRIGNSPASRYAAADFTPWIQKKLRARQFDDIAYLMTCLTAANPGLGIDASYWMRFAVQLCALDLKTVLLFKDDQAYIDLHSALFPYALHGAMDAFMIIGRHLDYLVHAVSPYPFAVIDLDSKILAANDFIKRMQDDIRTARAWANFAFFDKEALARVLQQNVPAPALREKLKDTTIGARQTFFGTLHEGPGQGAWAARPFGINEDVVSKELAQLGLGVLISDPSLVLMTYRKDELLASLNGFPTKEGWSKKYLIKYMMKTAPVLVDRLTTGKSVLDIHPSVREDGSALLGWVQTMKVPLAIAMGFR